jgi:hypothetical protein
MNAHSETSILPVHIHILLAVLLAVWYTYGTWYTTVLHGLNDEFETAILVDTYFGFVCG